jgi:glycosyltransferase involved in cell wall biosynthesis
VTQVLYSGLGGHAGVAFSLLRADAGKAWQSSLLFVGTEPVLPEYGATCDELKLPFLHVRTRRGKPWLSWFATFRALRKLRPDVVILHSVSSLLPVVCYCLLSGARHVPVEHTPLGIKTRGERIASSLALRLAKRVVVLSDAYRDALLRVHRGRRAAAKVVVIPNGIDVAAWERAQERRADGKTRIGMAARFSALKRQDVLVEALASLRKRRPEVDWQLSLAGDGECRERVSELAVRLGCADAVELTGSLDQDRLVAWYRSLDVYAHASEGEVLSISMLQAMAMRLPIVGSPVEGIRNLLVANGGEFGLLAEGNTGEAFSACIERLVAEPSKAAELADAALARARAAYSQEAMFDAYHSLLKDIRSWPGTY